MVVDEIDLIIQKWQVGFCLTSLISTILSDLSISLFEAFSLYCLWSKKLFNSEKGKTSQDQSLVNTEGEKERRKERERESSCNIRLIEIWVGRREERGERGTHEQSGSVHVSFLSFFYHPRFNFLHMDIFIYIYLAFFFFSVVCFQLRNKIYVYTSISHSQ